MVLKAIFILIGFGTSIPAQAPAWGFYAHKKINRLAVFTLPEPMIVFYKENIGYLEETSVQPDKRRYVVPEEAGRHYLDADHYGDSAFYKLPRKWTDAIATFGEDSVREHGVLPWHLVTMYHRLRDAFFRHDKSQILKTSAELGHYISDAHVPLHTTRNYNGQLTGQDGIHGFWESRLPELFSEDYDFFVGPAVYLEDPQGAIWDVVITTHQLVGKVLKEEKQLATRFGEKRYAFETRGATTVKVYAADYARAYHQKLKGMVEQQMRASIRMTGNLWYTAWIDAGQPELRHLLPPDTDSLTIENFTDSLMHRMRLRPHE